MSNMKPTAKKQKSPILAALLVILFGIGYLYIGRVGRFVIFWVVMIGIGFASEVLGLGRYSSTINGIAGLIFMVDAYRMAQKQNEPQTQSAALR